MTQLLLALVGAYGVHLLYTASVFGWKGVRPGPRALPEQRGRPRSLLTTFRRRLYRAGITGSLRELFGLVVLIGGGAGAVGWALFGGAFPPVAFALAVVPFLSPAPAAGPYVAVDWPRRAGPG
jgi:hypothetical protein